MRFLRSLLMIVGLLALVAGGAVAATPEPMEPPCHAMASVQESGDPSPTLPAKVMNCCVAWVVAPPVTAMPLAAPASTPSLPTPALFLALTGVSPELEITPPRA